jgi:AcrR family transcriptional regulator
VSAAPTITLAPRRIAAPERRRQLLGAAAELILDRGLTACTLEEVARLAGVSKALVYKHFPNRERLWAALIEREFAEIRKRGLSRAPHGAPFREARRAFIRSYLGYLSERGALLGALLSDRSISDRTANQRRNERGGIERYFAREIVATYGVREDLAQLGLMMTLYAPETAIGWIKRRDFDLDLASDFWATFLDAGWTAVAAKFPR